MELTRRTAILSYIKRYSKHVLVVILFSIFGWLWRCRSRPDWFSLNFTSKKTILPKRPRKKKLLSISLDKIVLWNPSKDPAVPNYAFVESVVPMLRKLCERYDVYLIGTVASVKEQKQIEDLIYNSDLSRKYQLDIRKVVFCQTSVGRSHIVRHIEPHIHVDSELDVVKLLRVSISRLILILAKNSDSLRSNTTDLSIPSNIEVCRSFPDSSLA